MMQFQVAYDLNADGNVDDGTDWHDLGVVQLDPPTLGDMSAQTASVYWNTTGLPEGQYLLRVIAVDECGNWRPGACRSTCGSSTGRRPSPASWRGMPTSSRTATRRLRS